MRRKTMYLKSIHTVNVGPIKDVKINFPFTENNLPKPVVIVGENGTGKSILLSNVVDSFHEIAGMAFDDARKPADFNIGQQYYKIVSGQEIHIGEKYMYSRLQYEDENVAENIFEYLFKGGEFSIQEFCNNEGIAQKDCKFHENGNDKQVTVNEKDVELIFGKNVICYFPPSRYEKPNWLGTKYYETEKFEHPSIKERFSRRLNKPIAVENVTQDTLQWLLDVIVDSRYSFDTYKNDVKLYQIGNENEFAVPVNKNTIGNLISLEFAKKNVESIMSQIIGQKIYFGLNHRNANKSRFYIFSATDGKILVPSLDSLSTGQSALFNMFATIIRYADGNSVLNGIDLKNITGIVVIDEVELHLHSNLQRDVLPRLLKLFPKVQFIVSSHSPLFLLGMNKEYGENGYEIYQMPHAKKITAEQFSEFEKEYEYLADTEKHRSEINEVIKKIQGRPLIITEGKTDWKHIKHALEVFKSKNEFVDLDIHFLEYEDDSLNEAKLGKLLENLAKVPNSSKIIGIFDNDTQVGQKYLNPKCLGNNVYACSIVDTQGYPKGVISIELLYSREELVNTFDENRRRVYLSDEFTVNSHRLMKDKSVICSNNAIVEAQKRDVVKIIDDRVFDENENNIALSKADFAKYVYDAISPFSKLSVGGFRQILETIKQILDKPNV